MQSIQARDELLKNSNKLKNATEIWKKVYIKKDRHPVYVAENNRLRTKMMILRQKPENKDKKIVISNGKLYVNDDIVEKNSFFS